MSLIVECSGAYRELVRLERLVRLSGRIGPGNGGCKSCLPLLRLCGVFGFGLSNVVKVKESRMEGREEARKQLVDVLLDVCQWRLVAATHLHLCSISGPSPDSGVACPCPVPQCSSGLPNLQSQSTVLYWNG